MRGSPELSKLTKAPRFGAITFRKQNPGSPIGIIVPSLKPPTNRENEGYVDPSHPATKLKPSAFPHFRSDAFNLRAAPVGLLWKMPPPHGWPFRAPFETWSEKVARHFGLTHAGKTGTAETEPAPPMWEGGTSYLNRKRREKRKAFDIPMSFFAATNQKRMGGKAVYVGAIKRKIKMATRLVVLRGAKVEKGEYKGTPYSKVVFDEEEVMNMDGKGWIMPGWSYVFFPTTEVYRMPYPDLVNCIRDALRFVYTKASAMEQGWLKAEERKLNFKNTLPLSSSKPGSSSRAPTAPRKSPKSENAEVKKPGKSNPMEAWLRYKGLLTRPENSNRGT